MLYGGHLIAASHKSALSQREVPQNPHQIDFWRCDFTMLCSDNLIKFANFISLLKKLH